jgi:hypothetical protein
VSRAAFGFAALALASGCRSELKPIGTMSREPSPFSVAPAPAPVRALSLAAWVKPGSSRIGTLVIEPLGDRAIVRFGGGPIVGTIEHGVLTDGSAWRRGLPGGDEGTLLASTNTPAGPVVVYGLLGPAPLIPQRRGADGWTPLERGWGNDTPHLIQLLPWKGGAVGLFESRAGNGLAVALNDPLAGPERTWLAATTNAPVPPPWQGVRARAFADASGSVLFLVGITTSKTIFRVATSAVPVDVELPFDPGCIESFDERYLRVIPEGKATDAWILVAPNPSPFAKNARCDAKPRVLHWASGRLAEIAVPLEERDEHFSQALAEPNGTLRFSTYAERVVTVTPERVVRELLPPRAHKDGTHAYAWLDGARDVWRVENGVMIRRSADGSVTSLRIPKIVPKEGGAVASDPTASPEDCRFVDEAAFLDGDAFFPALCFVAATACEHGCTVVFRASERGAPVPL